MDGVPELVAGRYRVKRKLGEGGLGAVYEALDKAQGTRIALKLIRTAGANASVSTRALGEYRALDRLTSSHIARVFDFGEDGDSIYLVQEFVEGETLNKLVPLPLHHALTVARGIADGLADAHVNGFIHRDVNPTNVIIPWENGHLAYASAKLLDFGVAGILDRQYRGQNTTMAGQFYGTPLYMSPEQVRGEHQNTAADVYGLGVLLFEMLFGRPPFSGPNAVSVLAAILSEPLAMPVDPAVPSTVRAFIERCMAKAADQRPRDGRAALIEIETMIEPALDSATPAGFKSMAAPMSRPMAASPRATSARLSVDDPLDGPTLRPTMARPLAMSSRGRTGWLVAGGASVVGIAALFFAVRRTGWIALGLGGLMASWGLAWLVHRWIERRRPPLGGEVANLLGRATALEDLTKSLAIDVGQLVEVCRQLDEQILAKTLALMIGEYDKANASLDRQGALMKAVELMEKLQRRMTPWYVRHQALLSWGIGVTGTLLSTFKTLREVWPLVKR